MWRLAFVIPFVDILFYDISELTITIHLWLKILQDYYKIFCVDLVEISIHNAGFYRDLAPKNGIFQLMNSPTRNNKVIFFFCICQIAVCLISSVGAIKHGARLNLYGPSFISIIVLQLIIR